MAIDYRTEPDYWEYLDGEAHPKVSPRPRHAVVQFAVGRLIATAGTGFGKVGTEWDVWLHDRESLTKFIPDVSFFSFERLRAMRERGADFRSCAPDVAVEVLSPGDSRAYLKMKIELYLSHGSLVVLDVDPRKRTIHVWDRAGRVMRLLEEDRFEHPDVPWLRFAVRDAFADLDDIPE